MATSNKKTLYYNKVVKRYQEGKSHAVISKELFLVVKTVEHWGHDFLEYTPRILDQLFALSILLRLWLSIKMAPQSKI